MSAKQLLPNQCDLLHLVYGQPNCCLCGAKLKIDELEEAIKDLKELLAKEKKE